MTNIRHLLTATGVALAALDSKEYVTFNEVIKVARSTPWGKQVPVLMLASAIRQADNRRRDPKTRLEI